MPSPFPRWLFVWAVVTFVVSAVLLGFGESVTTLRAGMADRETVGLLGIDIDRRFTIVFGLAAIVAGMAGAMYTPLLPPNYHMGMDFLVLSFVVVVVGGMGSLPGAVAAGFILGILQSFASMTEVKALIPGIDQIIIYLVAVVILLVRVYQRLMMLPSSFGEMDSNALSRMLCSSGASRETAKAKRLGSRPTVSAMRSRPG